MGDAFQKGPDEPRARPSGAREYFGAEDGAATTDSATDEPTVRLLVASGRPWLATALDTVLAEAGYGVERIPDAEELLVTVESEPPSLVLLDAELSGGDVAELCRSLVRVPGGETMPLLVYASGLPDDAWHAEILEAGAWQVLREPIRARTLVATVRRMLDLRSRVAGGRPRLKLREGQELEFSGVLTIRPG